MSRSGLWLKIFSVVTLFFLSVQPVFAFEQINHFSSEITVEDDTSLSIQETIEYTTNEDRHGIYRYIPVRYQQRGYQVRANITDVGVTDDQGKEIPFEQSWENGNLTFKIGDPDRTFTGDKTYVIRYKVQDAVFPTRNTETQQDQPELYWDITGEGWKIDIATASATIYSPSAKIQRQACFTGAVGGDATDCSFVALSPNAVKFETDQEISYGENFTVALAFDPSGGIQLPTPFERWLKRLQDNLSLLAVLLPGGIMFGWWWQRGRDQAFLTWNVFNSDESRPQQRAPLFGRQPIPMVYAPIAELTPGEVGALYDEKVDIQDIVAELIDLARQKFLEIERTEEKKFLWKELDYVFTRLSRSEKSLPAHQKYLLEKIFESKKMVKLSELKGTFSSYIEKIRTLIWTSLTEKKMFTANPSSVRSTGVIVAVVLLGLAFFWTVALLERGIFWALPLFGLSATVSIVSGLALPARTATGRNFALQALGLQRSIRLGAWREKIKEKHLFFEEVLPFAIALGVVKQLSSDMADLEVKAPDYLAATNLNALGTANLVQSFTDTASSSLSHNPSSSSWSGGSGFSGGSSGGGGGGGGGGSW